jgi:light-regulated signal transduction histidine kinase (bacteriophytochrome)
MAGGQEDRSDVDKELRDLGHLAAAIGHNLINSYSAIVSNAELIRSRTTVAPDSSDVDDLAAGIVETSLEASRIARKLIDWTRRTTAVSSDSRSRSRDRKRPRG